MPKPVPHEPGKPVEPIVTINGHRLSIGESMTMRVALGAYLMDLQEHGLGDDEHGKAMCEGYSRNIRTIMQKCYNYTDTQHGERIPNG